jgi:ShK domain-like
MYYRKRYQSKIWCLVLLFLLTIGQERKGAANAAIIHEDDTESSSRASSGTGSKQIPQQDIQLVLDVVGADLGVPQIVDPDHYQAILDTIQQGRAYVASFEPALKLCKNQNENCGIWAALGECDKNPSFMRKICAVFCKSCQEETTCSIHDNEEQT